MTERTKRSRNLRRIIVTVFTTITFIHMGVVMSLAQEHEVIEGGRYLYQKYCVSCHGTRGKGDGPIAPSLLGRPPDLTQLSRNSQGNFPFWRVYRVIDGREYLRKHGTREMPVWGIWFRIPADEIETDTDWADQVRGRLWQLLSYLESIQE